MRGLVDPVWPLLIAIAGAWTAVLRAGRGRAWARRSGTAALVVLWLAGSGPSAWVTGRVLDVSAATVRSPRAIFVLGGGYEVGESPAEDFLGTESIRRAHRAARLAREYPDATIVVSGREPGTEDDRPDARHAELMAERLRALGVDDDRIVLETTSANTRGHAVEASRLDLVTTDSPIAVVSSNFHLRRARLEFSRYFADVTMVGTEADRPTLLASLSPIALLPTSSRLEDSALAMREVAAIAVSLVRG